MRREEQRLYDILDALDSVARIIGGITESEFLGTEVIHLAVAQQLTVVGEAAAGLSRDLRERYQAIPCGHHRFSEHSGPRILWHSLAYRLAQRVRSGSASAQTGRGSDSCRIPVPGVIGDDHLAVAIH